ncbi:MAG: hypothetical protein U1E76_22340 [Planctomycetota bacterium]
MQLSPPPAAITRPDVISVGRYDGDSLLDLAVSAPGDPGTSPCVGQVFIFPGTSFPASAASFVANPPSLTADDLFGYDLVWGDRDGDGIDELLVGSPWFDYDQPAPPGYRGEGRCVLKKFTAPANTTTIDDPSDEELPGSFLPYRWGHALASGRLDTNGRIDFAIGNAMATYQTISQAGEVRVVIYQ